MKCDTFRNISVFAIHGYAGLHDIISLCGKWNGFFKIIPTLKLFPTNN